jgi:glycosyl-4,4'-diaponeurosporenoate acyltransferase
VLIELPTAWVIALNVTGWPVIQVGLARAFTRMPATWFSPPDSYGWEQGGRLYQRVFAIRKWKAWLPDAARWLEGGFAKGVLTATDADYLRRFIRETWRGELCHWFALACAPMFFLWSPLWADLVMVIYAMAANMPCILAQRYNRLRLQRLLARSV